MAFENYNKAIDLEPELSPAYTSRGLSHLAEGRYESAIADMDLAIELNPDSASTYISRGVSHEAVGNLEAAL
ncbi:MAG: tetratricopeptide repeat protein, partial [SAR202 cluster bacterium]|nr:tetratricopeptide repeat protein [SAR202 cluster bacterium]